MTRSPDDPISRWPDLPTARSPDGPIPQKMGRSELRPHQKNVSSRLVLILIALHHIAGQRRNAGWSLTMMRCLLESISKADQPAFAERRAAKRDAVRRRLRVEARRERRRRCEQGGDWGRRIHVKASWNRNARITGFCGYTGAVICREQDRVKVLVHHVKPHGLCEQKVFC